MTDETYPRDLKGYGALPPQADWPGGARLALQFVVNYEEGAENCVLHGDAASEAFLSEIVGAEPIPGMRHLNMESLYEYGARAGFWRLHRLFTERDLPVTVFGVAMALARNPEAVDAMWAARWEIASHGYRWIDYQHIDKATEREHLLRAIELHREATGERPTGWYLGRCSPNSHRLVAEEGGFLYNADSYADELPYWDYAFAEPQLMVPYTLDANDMRFATAQGFNTGRQFLDYLVDSFDCLYAEGATRPKMMSVGLHCRLAGRPGRARALPGPRGAPRRRLGLPAHRHRLALARTAPAASMTDEDRNAFVARYGGIYEHSPWVAERAFERRARGDDRPLAEVMAAVVDEASADEKLALIRAHPDLAGRAATAGELTEASTGEQASAGIDSLTPAEFERFTTLNGRYREKFGFPFVMAVRGSDRHAILAAFEERLANDRAAERKQAMAEIHRIARLRLDALEDGS